MADAHINVHVVCKLSQQDVYTCTHNNNNAPTAFPARVLTSTPYRRRIVFKKTQQSSQKDTGRGPHMIVDCNAGTTHQWTPSMVEQNRSSGRSPIGRKDSAAPGWVPAPPCVHQTPPRAARYQLNLIKTTGNATISYTRSSLM